MRYSRLLLIALGLCLIGSPLALAQERVIELEGSWNLRDLGGYPTLDGRMVKWGQIFRGSELSTLTEKDQAVVEALGWKTIVDFRTLSERRNKPDLVPATVANVFELAIHSGNITALPGLTEESGPQRLIDQNLLLARDAQEQFTEFFDILENPANAPLFFHCSGGKDRTGFAAALILSALGVERSLVMQDYLLSAPLIEGKYRETVAENPLMGAVLTVRAEYLQAAFDLIDLEYGGMDNYLRNVLNVDVDLLRQLYTE